MPSKNNFSEIISKLDLEVTYSKLKDELSNDSRLIPQLFELKLIDNLKEDFLSNIIDSLKSNYITSPSIIFNCPKSNYHIRPACYLTIKDQIIFSAIIIEIIKLLHEKKYKYFKKYSYNLAKVDSDVWFAGHPTTDWTSFEIESKDKISEGYDYILFSDISNFFDCIDIRELLLDLEKLGIPEDLRNCLNSCLSSWFINRRGIPQGVAASSILADIYLRNIDDAFENNKVFCYRYMDDSRIFFKDKKSAVLGLHNLTMLLRAKGLNINSSKTKILTKKEAFLEIDEVTKKINDVHKKLQENLKEEIKNYNPYFTDFEYNFSFTNKNVSDDTLEKNKSILHTVFDEIKFTNISDYRSLFNFIINRLGRLEDNYALNSCLNILIEYPENTMIILKYFSRLSNVDKEIVANFLGAEINNEIFLEHNVLHSILWLLKNKMVTESSLDGVRRIIFSGKELIEITKIYAYIYLGEYGNNADLQNIKSRYNFETSELVRSAVLYSLRKLIATERNLFYTRCECSSIYIKSAVNLAKRNISLF